MTVDTHLAPQLETDDARCSPVGTQLLARKVERQAQRGALDAGRIFKPLNISSEEFSARVSSPLGTALMQRKVQQQQAASRWSAAERASLDIHAPLPDYPVR